MFSGIEKSSFQLEEMTGMQTLDIAAQYHLAREDSILSHLDINYHTSGHFKVLRREMCQFFSYRKQGQTNEADIKEASGKGPGRRALS